MFRAISYIFWGGILSLVFSSTAYAAATTTASSSDSFIIPTPEPLLNTTSSPSLGEGQVLPESPSPTPTPSVSPSPRESDNDGNNASFRFMSDLISFWFRSSEDTERRPSPSPQKTVRPRISPSPHATRSPIIPDENGSSSIPLLAGATSTATSTPQGPDAIPIKTAKTSVLFVNPFRAFASSYTYGDMRGFNPETTKQLSLIAVFSGTLGTLFAGLAGFSKKITKKNLHAP